MKRKLTKYEQLLVDMFPPSQIPHLKSLTKTEACDFATKAGYHWHSKSNRWVSVQHYGKDGTINNQNYGRYPEF